MRRSSILAAAAFLLPLALHPAETAAGQSADADAEAIRRVIVSAYVEGIHKNGSREDIRAGFHPAFVMKVLQSDSVVNVPIEGWIARMPAPGTPSRRAVTHRIPDVSVSGSAAVARVEILFDGRHVYTDYMSLYRFAEGWRIVAKIYHTEP